jgi:uncharacterized protein involved in response to NO
MSDRTPILLATGYRPFFLLCGAYAATTTLWWAAVYAGFVAAPGVWAAADWHAHEMLFGFATAAIAGFLLTAVPNWTGSERVHGRPLAVLVGLWLLGRILMASTAWLPSGWEALELALLPALAWAIGGPILASPNWRNRPILLVVTLLFVADTTVHLGQAQVIAVAPRTALRAGLYLVVVLLTIVSGRIVPAFTRNAFLRDGKPAEIRSGGPLEAAVFVTVIGAFLLDLRQENSTAAALTALVAALLLAARQARWQPWRTLGDPILWVLHAGHAWLAVGFACRGMAGLSDAFPASTSLHALSAGAIGTSIIAVMSRVALGHAGRPLVAPRPVVLAYALVILGALIRVFGPLVLPDDYAQSVALGGLSWGIGFAVFTVVYAPILTAPREDGRPG